MIDFNEVLENLEIFESEYYDGDSCKLEMFSDGSGNLISPCGVLLFIFNDTDDLNGFLISEDHDPVLTNDDLEN